MVLPLTFPDGKGQITRYTIGDTVAIEKYDILKFSGAYTVAKATAANDKMAGIAAEEKVANDGATTIGVYTNGIFDIQVGGAVAIGEQVAFSGANAAGIMELKKYTTLDDEIGETLGKALELNGATETNQIAIKVNC